MFGTDTNDPFHTHRQNVTGSSRNRAPQEMDRMADLGANPFMVNSLNEGTSHRQLSVKILNATGLPAGSSSSSISVLAKVSILNKPRAMLMTGESSNRVNPDWNNHMAGNRLPNWVPGDRLVFEIFEKDHSMMSTFSSPTVIARAELNEYSEGYSGPLQLNSLGNTAIPGAWLYVDVTRMGVGGSGFVSRMKRMCGFQNARQLGQALWHAPESIVTEIKYLLGSPDDDRNQADMILLVIAPYLLFIFLTWMGWILRHYCNIANVFIVGICALFCVGLILCSVTVQKKNKKPLFALGCLSLLAVIVAVVVGHRGWDYSWHQWWWMQTGRTLGSTAGTPAPARSDAAIISFATVKNGTAWTSVDANRAAGYRDGDIYCAAPILDPNVALGDIIRVEYWALGINCCDDFGSFTCDASREFRGGGTGVVMKGGGMPCNECHTEKFRLAAAKASGVNRMVSAPGALYVRYVSAASTIENEYLGKCVRSFFWSLLFGMLIFGTLGFVINYKGWGKQGRFPLYHLLDERKKQPPQITHAAAAPALKVVEQDVESEFNLHFTQSPSGNLMMAATNTSEDGPAAQTNYGAF
jgi:hypothetical protein